MTYTLRPLTLADAEVYIPLVQNLDPEVARLTGTTQTLTDQEVLAYLERIVADETRTDWLIIAPDQTIIGEVVINEFDSETNSANFRMAIFKPDYLGQGIGTWAIGEVLTHAFEERQLNRLSLEVFSFNPRAQKAYQKAGFIEEGRLREAVKGPEGYADIILMAMLRSDWDQLKGEDHDQTDSDSWQCWQWQDQFGHRPPRATGTQHHAALPRPYPPNHASGQGWL